jgi:hypothetical protein
MALASLAVEELREVQEGHQEEQQEQFDGEELLPQQQQQWEQQQPEQEQEQVQEQEQEQEQQERWEEDHEQHQQQQQQQQGEDLHHEDEAEEQTIPHSNTTNAVWRGIRWEEQVPHISGLGNMRNPYNGCFAAASLQFLVAAELDLNLAEGIAL